MKRQALAFLLHLLVLSLVAQNDAIVHEYVPNGRDSTVYDVIQKMFKANDPYSYLNAFVAHKYRLSHLEPLRSNEGSNGKIAEANIYLPFTLMQGRNYSNNFFQSIRLTFDYWGQVRIVKDTSSPIIPPTNSFGLGFDWSFKDNFRKRQNFNECENERGRPCAFDYRNFFDELSRQDRFYYMWYLSFKLTHYSNGQGDKFYLDDNQPSRHNYKEGNFSTNYLQLSLNYNILSKKKRLFTSTIGIRQDIGSHDGFLSFEANQENSYGRTRLLAKMNWRSKPSPWWTYRRISTDCKTCKNYNLRELFDYSLRTEFGYILGNLSNWRQGNFTRARRFSMHLYIHLAPVRFRTVGFIFHYYHGRDYHNIRYDNVVNTWQMGISFNLNKYQPIAANLSEIGANWID